MAPTALYSACILGALGLYLVVRPGRLERARTRPLRVMGAILGLAVVGFLIVEAAAAIGTGVERPSLFYVIFSGLAIIAAVKVITHNRPVYSALYFVLVVISSAGLFLLLAAEFMAFALVIVYAGAILITYMFVLMLAQQSPSGDDPAGQPEYDLNPREPAAGVIVGFILLALLSRMIFDGAGELPPPAEEEARLASWAQVARMPGRLREYMSPEIEGEFELYPSEAEPLIEVSQDGTRAVAWYTLGDEQPLAVELPPQALPENVQVVGLALIQDFPVSLELAGVILLMAMFGAVVLARRQIELTEDETRAAAGLARLGHHDEPEEREGAAAP